jgi:hypothetical protein
VGERQAREVAAASNALLRRVAVPGALR